MTEDRVNYMYGDFDADEYKESTVYDDEIKLTVFQTLLAYNPDVNKAIEDTKMVIADLFPLGEDDEGVGG